MSFALLKDVIDDHNVICCDNQFSGVTYTYQHEPLGQYSWLDHFLMTIDLDRFIACCEVIESGENFSDHLHFTCILKLARAAVSEPQGVKQNNVKRAQKDRWDKANLLLYHQLSGLHLQAIDVPFDNLKCPVGCRYVAHRQSIDTYYKDIVCALKRASSVCVPRIPFKCIKPFWSDDRA